MIKLLLIGACAFLAALNCQAACEFEWNDWRVRVDSWNFADSMVDPFGYTRMPNPQAVFVIVDLTVRNDHDHGLSFIPQNSLKLIVGGNHIDCSDYIQHDGPSYLENIEPTLIVFRRGYFEVPRALLNQPMYLRFNEWFAEDHNVELVSSE